MSQSFHLYRTVSIKSKFRDPFLTNCMAVSGVIPSLVHNLNSVWVLDLLVDGAMNRHCCDVVQVYSEECTQYEATVGVLLEALSMS